METDLNNEHEAQSIEVNNDIEEERFLNDLESPDGSASEQDAFAPPTHSDVINNVSENSEDSELIRPIRQTQNLALGREEDIRLVSPFKLYMFLINHTDIDDLKEIAFQLNLTHEFATGRLSNYARELVTYCKRHDMLPELGNILLRRWPRAANEIIRQADNEISQELYSLLRSRFDAGELQTLCFALDIDYEALTGSDKNRKIAELLKYLIRVGRLSDIFRYGKQLRPDIDWDSINDRNIGVHPQDRFVSQQETAQSIEDAPLSDRAQETHDREDPPLFDRDQESSDIENQGTSRTLDIENQGNIFTRSKQLAGFIVDVKNIVENLSSTKPGEFPKIAASQIELLSSFYTLVLDQARQSFQWAIIAAGIGLIFFIVSITSILLRETTDIAIVSAIGGILIEFIAGINFYLFNKATSQLSEFHIRLELTQRFLLGNSMCEGLSGDFKQQARGDLVRIMVGVESSTLTKNVASNESE